MLLSKGNGDHVRCTVDRMMVLYTYRRIRSKATTTSRVMHPGQASGVLTRCLRSISGDVFAPWERWRWRHRSGAPWRRGEPLPRPAVGRRCRIRTRNERHTTRNDTVLFSKTMCDGYKQCATYNREKRNNPGGSLGTAAEDAWDHRTQ